MEKVHDIYTKYVNNGEDILEEIDFDEFIKIKMIMLRKNGFDVKCNEDSINQALEESEEIWCSNKIDKVIFIPGSLRINNNLEINKIIENAHIKDIKTRKWKTLNITDDVQVKTLISSININSIVDKFDRLKIKEGYTLQIYKVRYEDMWKGKIIAFKNTNTIPDINVNNVILDDYEVFNIEFKEEESSYLNAIESDESPEGYLQLVLLNNKINEICNSDEEYEIIDKRKVIGSDGTIIESPNFYYDEKGNATIEYFKKYNNYNGAYKRVINTFSNKTSKFKRVEQIVALYMN